MPSRSGSNSPTTADNDEKLTSFAVLILPPINTHAAGQPTITGTLEVGQILTADTSAISDADRMDNATFGYRWIAGDSDIQNATGMRHTLTEDEEGLAIRVSVTFTDDADNKETLTSDPTGLVQPRPNAPVIRGAVRVGETLTADTSVISDAHGMENASFAYRWLAGGTDIPGATGSNYTLTEDDEGLTILVWVSFTDDAGNPEALASSPTGAVAPRNPPPAPENLTGTANPDGSVTLSWEAPNDDSVTGYQILRRRPRKGENTLLVQVNDTGGTATGYTDRDVTPDVLYAYRVKAINPTGLSGQSNYVNVTPVKPADLVQNSPAMGRPTISGTTRVGETLTAETSDIADADGLTKVSHRYQWIASDGGADVDITGATGSTYTLVTADRGLYIKVRVSFKDDADNDENLTSVATDEVGFAVQQQSSNSPTTGEPTIIGPALVGETLFVDTSDIADADGLTRVSHRYQWVANDGDTDTDITGATGSTYTLMADDAGRTIKVEITVTDDAGNETTLISAATDEVDFAVQQQQASNSPATGEPTIIGPALVGETLFVDTTDIADADGLTRVSHRYQWVANDGDTDADITGATGSTYTLMADDAGRTIKVEITVTDDAGNETTLISAATDEVDFAVQQQRASNSPTTGQPTIIGTLRVGETLTADTTDIADADGLTRVSHRYQWVANDGDTNADITGATGSTYTLMADDAGKTIKVKVTVTDDAGNETTLISAATDEVDFAVQQQRASNSPTTGQPTITGTPRVGETLTADTSDIADADGLTKVSHRYQWVAGESDIGGATGSTYTLTVSEQGKTIKVKVTVTDDAGDEATLISEATEAVEAAPQPNSPTTGEPTIIGTLRVGETLTADTTDIADADGLTKVSHRYQWVAGESDIGGATGSTYTLTVSEQGKTIKVKVTVTDDAGNETTLISAATDEVDFAVQQQASNSPATGEPTIIGTLRVGETLTADTTGIADADGLENVSFSYQWLADDADISGATGSTYTLIDSDDGKTVKVEVSFTDAAGNEEALTSAGTDAVEAVPAPLTVSLTGAAPATHDGSAEFTFEIEFSEEFPLSFKKLKLHAFDVTNGEVLKAQRVVKSSNISWRIAVRPDSNADVTVVLPVTTKCGAQGAICTKDGRKLSNSLNFTVSGPNQ